MFLNLFINSLFTSYNFVAFDLEIVSVYCQLLDKTKLAKKPIPNVILVDNARKTETSSLENIAQQSRVVAMPLSRIWDIWKGLRNSRSVGKNVLVRLRLCRKIRNKLRLIPKNNLKSYCGKGLYFV